MEARKESSFTPPAPKRMKHDDSSGGLQVGDLSQKDSRSSAIKCGSPDDYPPPRCLTSDAHISKDKVLASQFTKQPVNIWYGQKRRVGYQESSQGDEPDTSYSGGEHSVPESGTDTTAEQQGAVVLESKTYNGGSENSSPSNAEDEGNDYDSSFGPVMAAPPPLPSVLEGVFPPPVRTIPTGQNTTIAVLDSGINVEHSAFQVGAGNLLKISPHSKSFVGESEDVTDHLGHGTQCAGLVCGSPDIIQLDSNTDQRVQFGSIAPDAQVMACKVVKDGTDIADIQAVCNAIDHVISYNRSCEAVCNKVNIISLSFGMEGFDHDLTNKIQEAVYEDIIVICAASNSGRKVRQPITYPARLGHVLCIGACTASGKPADFSPVGRELDFLANGENVWAPTVGGTSAYCVVNGTSFAAPLVAGVVCQLIEDLRRLSDSFDGEGLPLWRRVHNVWCVRELLKEMAVVQGKHSEENGFGALDPMDYFLKDDKEKLRIITKKILKQ